ncbi:MAG TPA: non-canonical purine NTP pyrophosphatase [Candidatus Saccharimonadales bacterium]
MKITFVTGNQHKADKTSELLGRSLDHEKVDLDELQTLDLAVLAEHKVRQAYDLLKKPVIVDDYGLGLDVYGGLPGPFVKFFIEIDDGLKKLCRMADQTDDRRARTVCVMAFYDGKTLKVFEKIMPGTISLQPIGTNGIHTDEIFIPDGYDKTRAQLNDQEYNDVYKKVRPLRELKEFLDSYYG